LCEGSEEEIKIPGRILPRKGLTLSTRVLVFPETKDPSLAEKFLSDENYVFFPHKVQMRVVMVRKIQGADLRHRRRSYIGNCTFGVPFSNFFWTPQQRRISSIVGPLFSSYFQQR
jgi:hypothetical protein